MKNVLFLSSKSVVMKTKLTLTMEQMLIDKAKMYAKEQGRSLSEIIANILKSMVKEVKDEEIEITPLVSSMKGTFKAPKDFEYKKDLGNELAKKYL